MIDIKELKQKLDFDSVLKRVSRYIYSGLGSSLCEEIEFMNQRAVVESELAKVVEFKKLLNDFGDLPLDGLTDIRTVVAKAKIEGHFISPAELMDVLAFLRVSRQVSRFAASSKGSSAEGCEWALDLCSELFTDKILEHNIEITIDETGLVKDTASSALSRIRKQISQQSEKLRKSLSSILKKIAEKEYTQEDIVTQRDGRYVIPVKTENKRNVQGIIHGASASGQTVFVEPAETIALNNELTELHFEERREIERILMELAGQVRRVSSELIGNCDILGQIDFLQAKAKYAIEIIAEMPQFSEDELELNSAYHPVLLQTHKRTEVVPLNFKIGGNFNTLVISGPNAGGKTVVLKTVGLCQLMLQSGMLIPVLPESKVKIYESVFISIGDEQSIENDLSTFSSHLKSVKGIVDNADNSSLVLIDEIASGTDPVLGSALSSAILLALSGKGSHTVVTTHNSELKEFAYSTTGIENASLEFDSQTLSPTFRFVTGLPGQSFTFEIARKFNFSEKLLANARSYLTENENRLEDLLKELNESKQKYDELKNKTDIDNTRLRGLINLYEGKLKELAKNEKVLKSKAMIEAGNIIRDARRLIEQTVKDIREEKISPKAAKEIISETEKQLEISTSESKGQSVKLSELKPGDIVRLAEGSAEGEVISTGSGMVSVNMNGILIKLSPAELVKSDSKKEKESYSSSGTELNEKPVNLSLDIRGKYTYEVKDMIDEFLYEASQNGLHEISIVHGKGGGKLRDEVRRQLKGHRAVKSFRLGNWNEGDTGVTIVEL